jgi:murein DD-endopeptidase MepM/ murein hydrolase activator NlpD
MRILTSVPAVGTISLAVLACTATIVFGVSSGAVSRDTTQHRIVAEMSSTAMASQDLALADPVKIATEKSAVRRAGAAASGTIPSTLKLSHFAGTIKGSLYEAAAAEGVPYGILSDVIKAFSYDVDFQRDIQNGDRFEILYERGADAHDGHILYASMTLSGNVVAIYRHTDASGFADYYMANGESVRKGLLRTPVDGATISSSFGMRRNPILGFSMLHKGIDFAVVTGTPVMAAGDGIVEVAGFNGAYGRYLRIRHDDQHATAYAHLSRFAKGLHVGQRVHQGEIVCYTGVSGRSTGPHLHYEVLVDNVQVNPMKVKFRAAFKLSGDELTHFQSTVRATRLHVAMTPLTTKVALDKGPLNQN